MKGKIWELGPFVLAVLVGLYFAARALRPSVVAAPAGPLSGATPRASTGPGDPTRPEDFLPDPRSKPDPNGLPDPVLSTSAAKR